jgi:hypothetical protein
VLCQSIVWFRLDCLFATLSTSGHAQGETGDYEGLLSAGSGLSPPLSLPPCVTVSVSVEPFDWLVSWTLLTFDFPLEKMAFHRFENSSEDTEKGRETEPLLILAISENHVS